MGRLWLFVLLAWLTQNPILALAVVLLLSVGSYGYITGRMFGIGQWITDRRAMRSLSQALAVASHDLTARAEMGRLLVRRGRNAEAPAVLEPAVQRQPDHPGVRADFGLALLRSGRVEEGERHLELALLRWADAVSGSGDHAKAIQLLEGHRELHSSSVEGLYKLGRPHLLVGDRVKARRCWTPRSTPTGPPLASSAGASGVGGWRVTCCAGGPASDLGVGTGLNCPPRSFG